MHTPPPLPPPLPLDPRIPSAPAVGPEECSRNAGGFLAVTEGLLRDPAKLLAMHRSGAAGSLVGRLLLISLPGAAAYGLVVGSFSGGAQYWAAPLKVSAGLMLSGVICLPSLYVFACLSGARARLGEVAGLVAGLLGLVTVLLLGFAPVAWLFSQSTTSAVTMGMLHLAFWITALMFGFRFLRAAFRQFEGHSMGVLRVWMFLFLLVTLQMTTSLRPLLESDSRMLPARKQFFLGHWAECLRAPAAEPETP